MVGIYKFTNKITGKAYIGQSTNIKKRYNAHKSHSQCDNDHLYFTQILKQYGFNNFVFEVLEECSGDVLNEREQYYIKAHKTYFPYGYNIEIGGSHHFRGLSEFDDVERITDALSKTNYSAAKIGRIFGVSDQAIYDINSGKTWYRDDISYPIRPSQRGLRYGEVLKKRKVYVCSACGQPISKTSKFKLCRTCYNRMAASRIPDKETLYQLLLQHSFIHVGKLYGVSDVAVHKWCDKYHIPRHASYYRSLAAS